MNALSGSEVAASSVSTIETKKERERASELKRARKKECEREREK